ncbi:hypothetical protein [Bacillus sp. AK128]
MNNFNQGYGSNGTFSNNFSGTDAQHVRQQNQQSFQYGPNGGQQPSFYNQQPQGNQFQGGQFGGPQAVFHQGFAGTDAQHVRQQNQQSAQGGQQQPFYSQQPYNNQFQGGQFTTGPQTGFQPGFAGTDAQHVRQQNQQSYQYGPTNGGQQQFTNQQPFSGQFQSGGFVGGPQTGFHSGYAGTDTQHVRQQNQQSAQGGQQYSGNQFGQGNYFRQQ